MTDYKVFCGLDVARRASRVRARPGGSTTVRRRSAAGRGAATGRVRQGQEHRAVLVVVDQPNAIGALPIAFARSDGARGGASTGLAMRRVAKRTRGTGKTDARRTEVPTPRSSTTPPTRHAFPKPHDLNIERHPISLETTHWSVRHSHSCWSRRRARTSSRSCGEH